MKSKVLKVLTSLALAGVLTCMLGTTSQAYVYPYYYEVARNVSYRFVNPDYHMIEYEIWHSWWRTTESGGLEIHLYDECFSTHRELEYHSYSIVDYNTGLLRCDQCGDEYYMY